MLTREQKQCPRCGEWDCTDPDSKGCSDNCIMRHQQENAALRRQVEELTADLRSRTEDWQYSEKLLLTANKAYADLQARLAQVEGGAGRPS